MNFARIPQCQLDCGAMTYVTRRETPHCKNQETPSATRLLDYCATATVPIFNHRGRRWTARLRPCRLHARTFASSIAGRSLTSFEHPTLVVADVKDASYNRAGQ